MNSKDIGVWWKGDGCLVEHNPSIKTCPPDEVVMEMTDRFNHHWSVSHGTFSPNNNSGKVQRLSIQILDCNHPDNDWISIAFSIGLTVDPKRFPCIEPTTEDKLSVIKRFRTIESDIAIELFPSKSMVVDEANIYHIWLLEKGLSFFPFSLKSVFDCPTDNQWSEESICGYQVAEKVCPSPCGNILFLYLKTDKYIPWSKKQFIKGELFGEDMEAIEIISPQTLSTGTECLVLLPWHYTLPVGLGAYIRTIF